MRLTRRAFVGLTVGIAAATLYDYRQAQAGTVEDAPNLEPSTRSMAAEESSVERTIDVGGTNRRYVRYEPVGLDPTVPVPLMLVLHGQGSSGTAAERAY